MNDWKSFSRSVVIESNERLLQKKRGVSFSMPEELKGIIAYKPRTRQEIKAAFEEASRRLRQG